jgi:epoxyqueuosine reductase
MQLQHISLLIKKEAKELGFIECGITKAEYINEEKEHLLLWLKNKYYAGLTYMNNNIEKRLNPALLTENAKSVIVVLLNYYPEEIQSHNLPVISKYAYSKDYHLIIKNKLKQLLKIINEKVGKTKGRYYCDSAPLLEKTLARKAGLGWIGKNSLLINKKYGSFNFIGELVIDRELYYDEPFKEDLCGSCNKCIESCPTEAIIKPKIIDAGKCISYITKENKDIIPENLAIKLNNRLFGCDICQDVCPWNKNPIKAKNKDFPVIKEILKMNYSDWENIDEETFNKIFSHTPIKWAGIEKIKANLQYLKRTKN